MKVGILVCLLLVSLSTSTLIDQYRSFTSYAREYSKRYESKVVEYYRFAIYLKNMIEIEALNANPEDNAIYGETRFTDLTHHEAKALMGLILPLFPKYNYVANFTNDPNYKPKQTTPDIWNWQQEGAVGPIKDQGSCGSCWTFSTAGNI